MLLETALALESKLKGMESFVGKTVTVTTDEGYAEIIAEKERTKGKVKYPVVVMRSGNSVSDRSRYTNDRVYFGSHFEEYKGVTVEYSDSDGAFIPYNLHYRIELIAETRREIDAMTMWVMTNIKDRDYIDVKYKGYNNEDAVYCSLVKRGNIVRADDKDGNVTTLRRRIFDMEMTTLLTANDIKSEAINIGDVEVETNHLDKE